MRCRARCWWFTLRYGRGLHDWLVVGGAGLVVIGFNLVGCGMFVWKLCRPPLMVDAQLAQLITDGLRRDRADVAGRASELRRRFPTVHFVRP